MRATFPCLRLTCDVIGRTVCELNWVSIRSGDGFGIRSRGVVGEGGVEVIVNCRNISHNETEHFIFG